MWVADSSLDSKTLVSKPALWITNCSRWLQSIPCPYKCWKIKYLQNILNQSSEQKRNVSESVFQVVIENEINGKCEVKNASGFLVSWSGLSPGPILKSRCQKSLQIWKYPDIIINWYSFWWFLTISEQIFMPFLCYIS